MRRFGFVSRRGEAPLPRARTPDADAGRPLDDRTRSSFERSLGWDFSRVRIHADPADASVPAAGAVTIGEDIFLPPGRYAPGRLETRALLAHELVHVVQQGRGGAAGPAAGTSGAAEAEAARLALPALFGAPVTVHGAARAGLPQHSALSDELQSRWKAAGRPQEIFRHLAAASPSARQDPDVTKVLGEIFAGDSDALWMARTTQEYGPVPLWPSEKKLHRRVRMTWAAGLEQDPVEWALEESQYTLDDRSRRKDTKPLSPVKAQYFAGRTDEVVLIISGVHGDEPSGVEVAETLWSDLQKAKERPYYSVVVVPVLFPDNYPGRRRDSPGKVETNRNFPTLETSLSTAAGKKAFDRSTGYPLDDKGRKMLRENLILLELIEKLDPVRIASIHAHPGAGRGIFAEKRTADAHVEKYVNERDRDLALRMARRVAGGAGDRNLVAANRLGTGSETALYHEGDTSRGVSFGEYMRRPVREGKPSDRPSRTTITIEVAGVGRSDEKNMKPETSRARKVQIQAYADALREIFLARP